MSVTLQREINILGEPTSDRAAKKDALLKIFKESANPNLSPDQLAQLYQQIQRPILSTVQDPIEKCRELSISIIQNVVKRVDYSDVAVNLMPVLVAQLGQLKIVEPSEVSWTNKELRLMMLRILSDLVRKYQERFSVFVEDVCKILYRTLCDTFPDIRKESCQLVMLLCQFTTKQLSLQGGALTKALLPSLNHRHAVVRCVTLKALTSALIVDASEIEDCIKAVVPLLNDKNGSVREQLYILARDLLTKLMDRHIYGYKFLPILYGGLSDETKKLADNCIEFLDQVGAQFEVENKDRVKDELDYSDGLIIQNRPRVGSRHIARENIQKIVANLVEGLGDWNVETRYKSAQILFNYMFYAEGHITGYIGTMLPAIYKLLAEDEPYVMEQTMKALERVGFYVKPDTTMMLILPSLKNGAGGLSTFRVGCLRTLQGIITGTSSASLESHLSATLETLADKDLVQNENTSVIVELARSMVCLCDKLSSDRTIQFQYFYILLQLQSIPGSNQVPIYVQLQDIVKSALSCFATRLNVEQQQLYAEFFDPALSSLMINHTNWNQYSLESIVLCTILANSGLGFMDHLDVLVPIFVSCSMPERDFEIRQRILSILLVILRKCDSNVNIQPMVPYLGTIFKDVILKSCVWRAGKQATHLRSIGIELFYILTVQCGELPEYWQLVQALFYTDVLPVVLSNLDDDELKTRWHCLSITNQLLKRDVFSIDGYKKLYVELLKRLDDAKDEIRVECAVTWTEFFNALDRWNQNMKAAEAGRVTIQDSNGNIVEVWLDNGHFEAIVDGLIIHLDDTNQSIQERVCDALQAAIRVVPRAIINEKVASAKKFHRSSIYLDKLLEDN